MNKLKILAVLILLLCPAALFAQDDADNSKYTTQNVILSRVTECRYGIIIDYFSGTEMKTAYIPNKFFISGKAVKIPENDTNISPQMNIIYKDLQPFRVKLYIATKISNLTYQYMDFVSADIAAKFQIDELTFEF